MARTEKIFQGEFPRSFKIYCDEPFFYHKIRDDGGYQPFDAFGIMERKEFSLVKERRRWKKIPLAFAFEYKMNYAVNTMNMKSMFNHDRYHQIKNLLKWENVGGISWFLFNWSVPLVAKKRKRINRTFAVTAKVTDFLYHRETIKMEEFIEEHCKELERKKDEIGQYYWDLTPLFD